jgi:hypothetical protein
VTQFALDLRSAQELRDAGIADVTLSHERWMADGLRAMRLAANRFDELTSDEVRACAVELGVPEPASQNVWGAVFREARRLGWIEGTDRVRKCARREARAHRGAVWISRIREARAA